MNKRRRYKAKRRRLDAKNSKLDYQAMFGKPAYGSSIYVDWRNVELKFDVGSSLDNLMIPNVQD